MALDVGALVVRVEAQTASLDKAVKEMRRLTNSVVKSQKTMQASLESLIAVQEKQANSIKKGVSAQSKAATAAKRTEAALARQSKATLAASVRGKNLIATLNKMGGSQAQIRSVETAISKFSTTMKRGALTTQQFGRAQAVLSARLARTRRTMPSLTQSVQGMSASLKEFTSSTILAVGPLSGIGARLMAFNSLARGTNILLASLTASMVALGAASFFLTRSTIRTGLSLERITARLETAKGSAIGAQKEFRFISKVSEELGLNIEKTADEFSLLQAAISGSNISAKAARDLFIGAASASAALKLSADKTALVFLALRQIVSKGKVSMEEISRQLGETLPGALRLAADAMDVTIEQFIIMTRKGKVLSDVFIPRFGKLMRENFEEKGRKAADSMQGSINRLSNAFFRFNIKMDESFGVSDKFKRVLISITSTINSLTSGLSSTRAALGAFLGAIVGLGLASVITNFTLLSGAVLKFAAAIRTATAAIIGFQSATPIGLFVRLATVITSAALGWFLFKRGAEDAAASMDPLVAKVDAYSKAFVESKKIADLTLEGAIKLQDDVTKKIQETRKEIINLKDELAEFGETSREKTIEFFVKSGTTTQGQLKAALAVGTYADQIEKLEQKLKGLGTSQKIVDDIIQAFTKSMGKAAVDTAKYDEELLKLQADSKSAAFANSAWNISIQQTIKMMELGQRSFNVIALEIDKVTDAFEKAETVFSNLADITVFPDTTFDTFIFQFEKANNLIKQQTLSFEQFANTVSSGLANGIVEGENLIDTFSNITKEIARMTLKMAIFNALSGAANQANPASSVFFGASQPMADGGPVTGGRSFLVGERGPEIFTPGSSGSIISNNRIGGGGTNITQFIDARGATPGVEFLIARASQQAEDRAVKRVFNVSRERSRRR